MAYQYLDETAANEYGIDRPLERKIRNWLAFNCDGCENPTQLAEECAIAFDHDEWLDEETHPLWEWVLDYFQED